ncbi:H/ACA ribonucleoprotein complex non-core subunit NAF1, partial [Durusdinium trenchii]
LVAQRIAQQEEFAEQVLRDGGGGDGARRRAPSAQDVQKLLRLLRETSKLASKIGELPSQFDALVSEEAREACRAAAQAVTKLPLPESSVMEEDTPVGEENWGEWTDDPMHALAAVDLQSTEEEADEAEPSHAAAEPKQAQRAVEGDEEDMLIKVCANLAGVDKHHLSDNEIILPPAILVGNSTLLYAFRPGEQMLHRASPPQTAQYASFPVENLTLELELALELMQAF